MWPMDMPPVAKSQFVWHRAVCGLSRCAEVCISCGRQEQSLCEHPMFVGGLCHECKVSCTLIIIMKRTVIIIVTITIQFVTTAESVSESESHVYNVLVNSGYHDASLPSFDSLCERADEQLFGKSLPVLSTYCTAFYPHNGSSTMN